MENQRTKYDHKTDMTSASAKALRGCNGNIDYNLSFINLHKMCDRGTPEMIMHYKLALCLYKLFKPKQRFKVEKLNGLTSIYKSPNFL